MMRPCALSNACGVLLLVHARLRLLRRQRWPAVRVRGGRRGAPLVAEGARMRNCLATYAWEYARGSRVWTVHRHGVPVADMELAFGGRRHGVSRIEQLYGVANAEAPDEV